MSSLLRRVLGSGRLAGSPTLVVALILALTTIVALVQQRGAEQRRQLLFESQAEQIHHEILQAIEAEGVQFRTAVDFVAVTHPGPLAPFQSYFARQAQLRSGSEPSPFDFMLIEVAPPTGFGELQERERSLGNADFVVRSFGGAGDRIIITRTSVEPADGDVDVRGLDVTAFGAQFPMTRPDDGYAIRVLEPDPAVDLLIDLAGQRASSAEALSAEVRTFALLVSPVPVAGQELAKTDAVDAAGQAISPVSAIRLVPIDTLFAPVDPRLLTDLQATLTVEGIDRPVAMLDGPGGRLDDPGELLAEYSLTTDGQRWALNIVADDDFGPDTGLFDPLGTWAFGLTTAALVGGFLLARAWHGQRLVRAERELASALTVASTDGLTGLLNRVGFVQQAGLVDPAEPVSLFFIDLDGFKAINDLDGHEAGDVVLRSVAAKLSAETREQDLVSRLGGDEFIVHLAGADPEAAVRFASRVIDAVDEVDDRLSCSVGVARRRAGELTAVDELLRRADAAMYKVKRDGGRGFHLVEADDPPAPHAAEDGPRQPAPLG
ncbi:MAG: GGDEF domain-containing protein [Actinomycetota bacterium]